MIDKLDDKNGRAAIIENGSPLFTGSTSSGESQIRRYILENDLLEAIIALPTDLFYNTGIATYVWILSKNKRKERVRITRLYTDFAENEFSKIYDNEDFLYREYAIYQPLQRSYAITEERIEAMLQKGALSTLYDESKVAELESQGVAITNKDQVKLNKFYENKPIYEEIITTLKKNISDKKYLSIEAFMPVISDVLSGYDEKLVKKVAEALGEMDKTAEIVRDKKGNIVLDKDSKDTELVAYKEDISDYMAREVLPHIPDAVAVYEENLAAKKPVVKVGAEIPFTRYFYKYQQPKPSEELAARFMELEKSVQERIANLFC